MPSPFPGMDPYLERSRWFRGLHSSLVFCLQEGLQPLLLAPYFALTAELIWMEGSEQYVDPDVDVLRRLPIGPREAVESGEEGCPVIRRFRSAFRPYSSAPTTRAPITVLCAIVTIRSIRP